MSELSIIGAAQAKVIPLQQSKNNTALNDFFSHHGEKTSAIILAFLDKMFGQYQKTQSWQYLSLKEKMEVEINCQLLKNLIQNLKR